MALLRSCFERQPDGSLCGELSRGPRCPAHARRRESERHNPIYNDSRWLRLRRRVLARHWRERGPWCPGYSNHEAHVSHDLTVDHVVSLRDGGAPFDAANTRVICRSFNSSRRDPGVPTG